MGLAKGQNVRWTSSSNASKTEKAGTVVYVVPARKQPPISDLMRKHSAHSAYGHGIARDHESYVVLVPGKTDKAKPTLYWPRVKALATD